MSDLYKVTLKIGDSVLEVESSDKNYVDEKLAEYVEKLSGSEIGGTKSGRVGKQANKKKSKKSTVESKSDDINLSELVALIHEDVNYEKIEREILNKRDRLNKILLCFYFANKYQTGTELTTGQVEVLTDQLGTKIANSNVAKVIREGANKYLTANQVRKQGSVIKYKINRKGIQKYESIVNGD